MREATSSVEKQMADASQSVNAALEEGKPAADPLVSQLDGPPAANAEAPPSAPAEAPVGLNGASHPPEETTKLADVATPAAGTVDAAGRATEKSGA
jgi:hypothetical protein